MTPEPVVGTSDSNIVEIAHAATNSVIHVIAKQLRKLGLQRGVDDDGPLRETV
jgi:hypothetical protein